MMVAEMKNDSFLPARSPACPLLSSRIIAAIDASSVRCWQVFIPIGGAWTSRGGSLRCATCKFFRGSIFCFRLARQKEEFDSPHYNLIPSFFRCAASEICCCPGDRRNMSCLEIEPTAHFSLSPSLSLSPWTETSEAHTTHIT